MGWNEVVLCAPSDLDEFEADMKSTYNIKTDRCATAKRLIARRLGREFHEIYPYDSSITSDLDRITNPVKILKDAAIFLTLHLIFEDLVEGLNDTYNARKSELYWNKYNLEMKNNMMLLDFYDEDMQLSGQMQESENWVDFRLM